MGIQPKGRGRYWGWVSLVERCFLLCSCCCAGAVVLVLLCWCCCTGAVVLVLLCWCRCAGAVPQLYRVAMVLMAASTFHTALDPRRAC